MNEILQVFSSLILFLAAAIAIALFLFKFLHIDGEYRRKLLHTISFLIILILILSSTHWYTPVIICILFVIIVYPLLCICEKLSFYQNLFQQRSKGEVKRSLLLLFINSSILITLFWGIFGSELTVVASILAWGLGDEAAALMGKSLEDTIYQSIIRRRLMKEAFLCLL